MKKLLTALPGAICDRRTALIAVGAAAASAWTPSRALTANAQYKIVTASERGTYIQIGRDLSKFVAPEAGMNLEAVPSAGSAENVRRLRYEPGVKLAIVQSDVYQAFIDQSITGNIEARELISPMRLILPLYNEEIYFVVRADSPMNFVHDIKDTKINVGPLLSGTAMTATTVYRQQFDEFTSSDLTTFYPNEEALVRLTGDKSVDVVAIVGGQPMKLLADVRPEGKQLIKLLKVDPTNEASQRALKTYFRATVRASNYPNLLTEDIVGYAVKAYLVTYDFDMGGTVRVLTRFARSLCDNFDRLQAQGHPKWKEVELALPDLSEGWQYYGPTASELRTCIARRPNPVPVHVCSQQERILGLCK